MCKNSGPAASNELTLLDAILKQRQTERPVSLRDDEAFEVFAAEQALLGKDLSPDEIAEGIVGSGNDGGIDAIYVFAGDALIADDSDVIGADFQPTNTPRGIQLELWLVQAKRETSFSESAIEKLSDSAARLLKIDSLESDLLELYSPSVVTRTGYFRKALQALAIRHPKVAIRFVYATRGRKVDINNKVAIKANNLEHRLANIVPGGEGSVEFLDATDLYRRVSTIPSYTSQLTYLESSTSERSHIALVRLRDYIKFLRNDDDSLKRHIFDWNVRDYQGDVEVNKEIKSSLRDPGGPDFWWLNNGITVVCSKASVISKTYTLDSVQIVNGLQTSHAIFKELSEVDSDHPALDRSVLVRILVTGDDRETRDRVIRATNRQTAVPAASLRATDDIQRSIEDYFFLNSWYYDRRKGFHRNNNRSPERIVSIQLLAQAVMAMGLCRPDDSRARPSSLLKRDEDYLKVFSNDIPLSVYLWLARTQKQIDAYLLSERAGVTAQQRTNFRFHLSMLCACDLVGRKIHNPRELVSVANADKIIEDGILVYWLRFLLEAFSEFSLTSFDTDDKVAKGSDFVFFLLNRFESNRHEKSS
ncbi:AIPR family protein [Lolliginicoccus levis]|uniref:AIPR family protein n=1 Tax=Lolliginicoccus levis TaxID=2919542 RepID=UPI00241FED6B|nr:AIPR family protein [Lolliginicoccus levis]